jgi:hypothetical protein
LDHRQLSDSGPSERHNARRSAGALQSSFYAVGRVDRADAQIAGIAGGVKCDWQAGHALKGIPWFTSPPGYAAPQNQPMTK